MLHFALVVLAVLNKCRAC